MNCQKANQISITGFLSTIGVNPAKTPINGKYWYCSPLRNEQTPSFAVWESGTKNVWFDHGTGTGGGLVDLVCKLYNVDVTGALLIIAGQKQITNPFYSDQPPISESSKISIYKEATINNSYLVRYIKNRGISLDLATLYTREIYYTVNEKKYFAIGFQNDLGGYELRTEHFKGSSSLKGITTIKGNTHTLNIFEGFFDFLSFLTWSKVTETPGTCIILNSVVNLPKIYRALPNYLNINLYLDNDPSGRETVKKIQNVQPYTKNQAEIIYPGFKDFNDFLTKKPLPV